MAGNWSQWSMWSDCSQTCNEGLKIRSRQCTPLLKNVVVECSGNNISNETCELGRCSGIIICNKFFSFFFNLYLQIFHKLNYFSFTKKNLRNVLLTEV